MTNSENLENAKTVLREWAIALRGDWQNYEKVEE